MLFLLIAAAWLGFGAAGVAIMWRRGHDPFSWAVLFVFLGPLALPLAISADRQPAPEPAEPHHDGALDVLAAVDSCPNAHTAVKAALRILEGTHIASLTIAAVLDVEAASTVRGREAQRDAHARLDDLAREVRGWTTAPVDTVVLFGERSRALQHFAAEHGYELIVVDGHGMSRRDRGGARRTAERLANLPTVPVLVAPVAG